MCGWRGHAHFLSHSEKTSTLISRWKSLFSFQMEKHSTSVGIQFFPTKKSPTTSEPAAVTDVHTALCLGNIMNFLSRSCPSIMEGEWHTAMSTDRPATPCYTILPATWKPFACSSLHDDCAFLHINPLIKPTSSSPVTTEGARDGDNHVRAGIYLRY